MKFAYEMQDKTVKIWRCFTYGGEIEIPKSINGYPVAELAPYACSAHLKEEQIEEKLKEGRLHLFGQEDEAPALCGPRLSGVQLPETLKKIGAYAFYNCSNLESLFFHGSLEDLGPGVFTGCHHMRRLALCLDETGISCLQELLMELGEELRLTLYQNGREARLIFPEFYEEGVENTPARILMTQMHGSGMHYRNCFYERKFDFHAYDSCFFRARALEDGRLVLELALNRLRFPVELGAAERLVYEDYVGEHIEEAGAWALALKDIELLRWLVEEFLVPGRIPKEETLLRCLLGQAARQGFTEGNAFLLQTLHQRFSRKEESFTF